MENSYRFFENTDCQYFPCHKAMDNFNCLFCYCPLYHMKHCPGKHQDIDVGDKKIKMCTDCTFPHQPENYDVIIKILENGKAEKIYDKK